MQRIVWWQSLAVLLVLCAAPSLRAEMLVCLGDSLTAGYGLDESQAWPSLLQRRVLVEHPRWTVVNAGVSGDTTAAGARRIGWVLKTKPDAVLVALGANDGLRGVPIDETNARLRSILQRIVAAGARPLVAGMQLPPNYGSEYRTAFAELFPAVAKEYSAPLLPFLLEGVAAMPALNLSDGVHPNEQGHQQIAEHVYDFLVAQQVLK